MSSVISLDAGVRTLTVGGVPHIVRSGAAAKATRGGGPTKYMMPPSKLAALLELDDYASPHDVWLRLVKGIKDPAGEAAEAGKRFEGAVGRWWVDRYDEGNFDRWTRGRWWTLGDWLKLRTDFETIDGSRELLEVKTCSIFRRNDWERGVPLYYQTQVQPYLRITDFERAHVALCIGGQRLESFVVERDDRFADEVLEEAWRFWREYVLTGRMPPTDASEAAKRALAMRFPKPNKNVRPPTPGEAELILELRELRRQKRETARRADLIENLIREAAGDDYGLQLPGIGKVLVIGVSGAKTVRYSAVVDELRAAYGSGVVDPIVAKHTTKQEDRRDVRPYFKDEPAAE